MHPPARGAHTEFLGMSTESTQLRAALARHAARRGPRPAAPVGAAAAAVHSAAAAPPGVWLVPKMPFIALWRLLLGLAGIGGVLALALLLAAGMALIEMHVTGR